MPLGCLLPCVPTTQTPEHTSFIAVCVKECTLYAQRQKEKYRCIDQWGCLDLTATSKGCSKTCRGVFPRQKGQEGEGRIGGEWGGSRHRSAHEDRARGLSEPTSGSRWPTGSRFKASVRSALIFFFNLHGRRRGEGRVVPR